MSRPSLTNSPIPPFPCYTRRHETTAAGSDGNFFPVVVLNGGVEWTDLKIMNPSGRRFGDADDLAILCDNDFGFDRMAFLLAGIPAPLFSAWPLDRLFRAVDNQGLGLLTTDVDHALHPENPRGHSFDPPQRPADDPQLRPRPTDARNGSSEPQSALTNEAADAQPTQGTYMAQRPSGSGIVACE